MALFDKLNLDKLNTVAKNIGDKTSDVIETTKLGAKVNMEKSSAEAQLKKIGAYYYKVFIEGGQVAPEVMEFCTAAKVHYDAAEAAQAEIDGIKSVVDVVE